MQTPREICMKLLISTEQNQSFSNIALDKTLTRYPELRDIDKRFISALYYGVIERKITLDAIIKKYSSRPVDKLSDAVRQILRMGIYQLLYMDSVPDNAAVNESVILAKSNKNSAVSGFVNALLRNFIRDGKKLPLNGRKVYDLSIEYSCPTWLIERWIEDYGEEKCLEMLRSSLGRAPVTARLNTCKFSIDEIVFELRNDNVKFEFVDTVPDCIEIFSSGSIEKLSAYEKGMLHVQDVSCQICSIELGAKPYDIVLDMCSAPGGKAFTIAQTMNDKGSVYAYDLHEKRVKLISDGAKRLHLESIKAIANNAKVFNPDIPMADCVLCDVPCSGLGVIRRKPEIKYSDRVQLSGLPAVQYDILSTASKYVKAGGTLMYSTCTVLKEENDMIVEKFLKEHDDFEPCNLKTFRNYKKTITPEIFGSDGFFIAKLKRKE